MRSWTRALAVLLGHVFFVWGTTTGAESLRILVPAGGILAFVGIFLFRAGPPPDARLIFGVALACRLLLFPAPPSLSDDVYRYLWDGRLTLQGDNPYETLPARIQGNHPELAGLYPRLNSPRYHSVYPPLAQMAFAVGAVPLPRGFEWSYYLLKAILAMAELAGLLALSRLVSGHRLCLYAWNPLVILETWGQPHCEALAVPALLFSILAWRQGRFTAASAALTLAGWAKLWPLLLLPSLIRPARRPLAALAMTAALSALLWIPFFSLTALQNMRQSLDLYVRSFEFNAGVYYALKQVTTSIGYFMGWLQPPGETSKLMGPALRWILLTGTLGLWWKGRDWPYPRQLASFLWLFLITLTTIHPWYLVPLWALIPLFEDMEWPWLPVSLTSLATYLFYTEGWYWPFVITGWTAWAVLSLRQWRSQRRLPFSRPIPSLNLEPKQAGHG